MQDKSFQQKEGTRQFERKPHSVDVDYCVVVPDPHERKSLDLRGRICDISDSGVSIETDYPLAAGHMLWFNGGMDKTGTVKWCAKINGTYRAGIALNTDQTVFHVREDTGDSLYIAEDLEGYNRLLDTATDTFNTSLESIEQRCYNTSESPDVIMNATEAAIDDITAVCAEFESKVRDKDAIRAARVSFHEKTNPMLSKSYCINRTRTWPQGAQGDHKTLEVAYRNTPLSDGIGYYLDRYLLNSKLAVGVRERIAMLEGILEYEIARRPLPFVLNIGCGSCRELMGIAPEIADAEARIVCIDNDNDALSFAQDRLTYAGILSQVELRKYNALRMFDEETNMLEFGKQDIIYSAGLFDYLPDDFLTKLLPSLYNLLNPGGILITPFKDADRYRSQDYHWIVDWDGFLQRRETDFRRILAAAGIPDNAMSTERVESGTILFYLITKQ